MLPYQHHECLLKQCAVLGRGVKTPACHRCLDPAETRHTRICTFQGTMQRADDTVGMLHCGGADATWSLTTVPVELCVLQQESVTATLTYNCVAQIACKSTGALLAFSAALGVHFRAPGKDSKEYVVWLRCTRFPATLRVD